MPAAPAAPARFSLGVNYWPRRSAMSMWRRFDPGEIAEDFARIAALGCDAVRIFLRWDDFQPAPRRRRPAMLARFETVAGLASDAGLRVLVVLFCGHVAGVELPARMGARSNDAERAVSDDLRRARIAIRTCESVRGRTARRADLVRAHRRRTFARPSRRSPRGISGHEFDDVRLPAAGRVNSGEHASEPAAEPVVAEWSRRLAAALAESSGLPVTAGTHAGDLVEDRSIRFGSLCAPFAFASMQGFTVSMPFAREPPRSRSAAVSRGADRIVFV